MARRGVSERESQHVSLGSSAATVSISFGFSLARWGSAADQLSTSTVLRNEQIWSRATAGDFEIYAANVTFEDPLMRAHG